MRPLRGRLNPGGTPRKMCGSYSIYDQNLTWKTCPIQDVLWPKRQKNHTLWGRTYLCSPHKRVPPGFTVDGVSCEDMMDHLSDTHDLNSCEIKPQKNSGLNGIRTRTHDLRYRFRALPTELSSQLGAGHIVSSQYTLRCWRVQWICERSYKLERWLKVGDREN